MLTNASPWSSPGLELPLRATTLLIVSYLPRCLHTNILGWFFPMIYLGNPIYCLLLQDWTDYWAYSRGHLDLTLRLFSLVIKPIDLSNTRVRLSSVESSPNIFVWKTWMCTKECYWNPWNYWCYFNTESFLVWFSFGFFEEVRGNAIWPCGFVGTKTM